MADTIAVQLSPEMTALLKALGVPENVTISTLQDLQVFSRLGNLAQQFGVVAVPAAGASVPALPRDPTNTMWCNSSCTPRSV